MTCRIVNLLARPIFLTAVIGGLLSAGMGFEPARAQTPPAASQSGSPAPATPQAALVTPQTAPAGTPQAAAPQAAPTVDDKHRSECEHFVAVLAGRDKDTKVLSNPEFQSLGRQFPDLTTCGAVATDSDAMCKPTGQVEPKFPCPLMQGTFHELRAHPQGGRFIFIDSVYEHCRTEIEPIICDKVHQALLAGDPSKCEWSKGEMPQSVAADAKHHPKKLDAEDLRTGFPAFCRALVTLDKSLCTRIKDPDSKRVCGELIERNAIYAKGLKALAESGPEPQRTLAKAALGQADACKSYESPAMERCMAPSGAAAPAAPPPAGNPPAPTPP